MGLLVNKRVDDEKYRYTIKDPEGYPDSTFIIDRSTLQGIMKDGYWSGGVNLACSEASNKDVEKARDEYKAKEKKDGESRNERVEKNKI
ncbi:hypothetical protein LMG8323_04183 [Ralstonia mannitolilytica]|nr:hypothetical protein LMG8323_04183 [Ralstonia mannitolilytica]